MPLDAHGQPDFGLYISGDVGAWRRKNPRAVVANVTGRTDLVDADFEHLRGLKALDMSYCDQPSITDAAFKMLAGVYTLNMCFCNQDTITGAAIDSVAADIRQLDVVGCSRAVRDAAIALASSTMDTAAPVHVRSFHGAAHAAAAAAPAGAVVAASGAATTGGAESDAAGGAGAAVGGGNGSASTPAAAAVPPYVDAEKARRNDPKWAEIFDAADRMLAAQDAPCRYRMFLRLDELLFSLLVGSNFSLTNQLARDAGPSARATRVWGMHNVLMLAADDPAEFSRLRTAVTARQAEIEKASAAAAARVPVAPSARLRPGLAAAMGRGGGAGGAPPARATSTARTPAPLSAAQAQLVTRLMGTDDLPLHKDARDCLATLCNHSTANVRYVDLLKLGAALDAAGAVGVQNLGHKLILRDPAGASKGTRAVVAVLKPVGDFVHKSFVAELRSLLKSIEFPEQAFR